MIGLLRGVLAGVGLWSGLILAIYAASAQPPQPLTLLGDCARPCWLGLVPGTSTVSDAETAMTERDIDYLIFSVSDNGTSFSLFPRGSSDFVFFVGGVVENITFQMNACAVPVLVALGTPYHFQFDEAGQFALHYPEQGVVFSGEHNRIHTVELYTPAELAHRLRHTPPAHPWRTGEARFRKRCMSNR